MKMPGWDKTPAAWAEPTLNNPESASSLRGVQPSTHHSLEKLAGRQWDLWRVQPRSKCSRETNKRTSGPGDSKHLPDVSGYGPPVAL